MTDKRLVGLVLSVLALSLSAFNLGMLVSKQYYKPQVLTLQKQVKQLKASKSTIIYQTDNVGGSLVGKVTSKQVIDGYYTVTFGAYGKFLVTKEQYDSINVGDDVPEYLKGGGIR